MPVFISLTNGFPKDHLYRTIRRTSIYVFVVCVLSFFIGEFVLNFFGVSIHALKIAGGIIITNSGFSLLNGQFSKNKGINKKVEEEIQNRNDIALTPLAMPMLAGPGSISLLIAYYQEHQAPDEIIISTIAIFLVAVSIYFVLRPDYNKNKVSLVMMENLF